LYFDDDNIELRRYSLAIFAVKLKHWETGSTLHFYKKTGLLRKYIIALIQNSEQIEKDFPYIFQMIIDSLIKIGEISKYSIHLIDINLYNYIKKELLDSKRHLLRNPYTTTDFHNFLKDLNI
ncbi:hypothetical protein D7X33_29415, partial [Butyricicoccus sp. 1XD8-22]